MGDFCTDVDPAPGLPGPNILGSLAAYQSRHEANVRTASALDLFPTSYWNDYLLWVRQAVGIDYRTRPHRRDPAR